MANEFDAAVKNHQVTWRETHVRSSEHGQLKGVSYPWILPEADWEEGLWPGIRSGSDNAIETYLRETGVQRHTGVNNLKSSWTLCANLYFSFRRDPRLLSGFLAEHVDSNIVGLERLELEYAENPPLDPTTLLGESKEGKRGAHQTSPDVAFIVSMRGGGRGLILTENKFIEKSFYPCSGRMSKSDNPDPTRCLNAAAVFDDPRGQCHQMNWETNTRANRKYWDWLTISKLGRQNFKCCPAATTGYQLFRQQALAEGIARSGTYDVVISCVAYDARNTTLIASMRTAGIDDFARQWGAMFDGTARFTAFTHQDWVQWVRDNDKNHTWDEWVKWVEERYGY